MIKRIILFVIILISIGLNLYFIGGVLKEGKGDKIIFNNSNIEEVDLTGNDNENIIYYGTGYVKDISLEEALKKEGDFSSNIFNINDDFNYSTILFEEFSNLKNKDDFLLFEEKFGTQLVMFTALKLKDKDIYLKYFDFLFDLEDYNTSKIEFINTLELIFSSYEKEGFFDDFGYIDDNGEYDYFRLSLMSKSVNDKIEICKKGFKLEDDYNSCVVFIDFMHANNENNYCNGLGNSKFYEKWCYDTLDLIK